MRVEGATTRNQAEALTGLELSVPRDNLPAAEEDEFYHADLIGLDVHDTGGARLGRVTAVQNHGASDLLEIDTGTGRATVLLPFTLAAVPTVDLTARRIVADPPEGLF